jgi:hypothetical protein
MDGEGDGQNEQEGGMNGDHHHDGHMEFNGQVPVSACKTILHQFRNRIIIIFSSLQCLALEEERLQPLLSIINTSVAIVVKCSTGSNLGSFTSAPTQEKNHILVLVEKLSRKR